MHSKDIQRKKKKKKIVYTIIFQKLQQFRTEKQFHLNRELLEIIRFFRKKHIDLTKTYSWSKMLQILKLSVEHNFNTEKRKPAALLIFF